LPENGGLDHRFRFRLAGPRKLIVFDPSSASWVGPRCCGQGLCTNVYGQSNGTSMLDHEYLLSLNARHSIHQLRLDRAMNLKVQTWTTSRMLPSSIRQTSTKKTSNDSTNTAHTSSPVSPSSSKNSGISHSISVDGLVYGKTN
jgi:hypothetical protein